MKQNLIFLIFWASPLTILLSQQPTRVSSTVVSPWSNSTTPKPTPSTATNPAPTKLPPNQNTKTVLSYAGTLSTFSHCPGYDWIQLKAVKTNISITLDSNRPGIFTADGIEGTYTDNNGNFRITKIPPLANYYFVEGYGQSFTNYIVLTVIRTEGSCYYKQIIEARR